MSDDLPAPVNDWPLADRIRWILDQPSTDTRRLERLITLVRDEKTQSVELALSLNICTDIA